MRRLTAFALLLCSAACNKPQYVRPAPSGEELRIASVILTGDESSVIQLVRGFHQVESGWRWTKGAFAVTLRAPKDAADKGAALAVHSFLPEGMIEKLGPMKVSVRVSGTAIGSETFSKNGDSKWRMDLAPNVFRDEAITIEFALDKFHAAGSIEPRELGLIAYSFALEAK
ncbi:MAG: hypothetical protein HYZ37_09935 [Candidatus Solibacter usitatus]|nr:hypothetical protein [Candidatus Solibacter usitatus]